MSGDLMSKSYYRRRWKNNNYPDRHGYTWSTREFDDLKNELDLNLDLGVIAKNHKRTVHVIQCAIAYKFPSYYIDNSTRSDIIINSKNYSDKLNKILQIIKLKVDILC